MLHLHLSFLLSSTKAHAVFVRQQVKLHPDKPKKELQRLSDTRWACRYMAVDAICCTFDSLLATLDEISKGDDHVKGVEAKRLLLQVIIFDKVHFLIYSKINSVI